MKCIVNYIYGKIRKRGNEIMKKYYSLGVLIKDLPNLDNESIYITRDLELDALRLPEYEFRSIKKKLKDKNVKMIRIKSEEIENFF